MKLGVKVYEYPHSKTKFYYLTLNGVQFGSVMFSQREVDERMADFVLT